MDTLLFDSEFLRKLDRLSLISQRLHRGLSHGERHSPKKGSSLEFFDYRSYQPGDDLRYIDWSIYSRFHRLFVKLFAAEEDLTIHLLVDTSASMKFGTPAKIDYAKRIAAALGYIGIVSLDRVGVTAFSDSIRDSLPPLRRRNHVFSLFEYCSRIEASGATRINDALKEYALRARRPGLAIVVSDLLDPEGYEEGLLSLLYRRFEVILVHLFDEAEVDPVFDGPTLLVDEETGEERAITADGPERSHYRSRVEEFFGEARNFALAHGMEYLRAGTSVPFEELVLRYLRQGAYLS